MPTQGANPPVLSTSEMRLAALEETIARQQGELAQQQSEISDLKRLVLHLLPQNKDAQQQVL